MSQDRELDSKVAPKTTMGRKASVELTVIFGFVAVCQLVPGLESRFEEVSYIS